MPLATINPVQLFEDMGDIHFAMMDGETKQPCIVTFDYLQDRARAEGARLGDEGLSCEEAYLAFRDEIESLASQKYDTGERPPRIGLSDL